MNFNNLFTYNLDVYARNVVLGNYNTLFSRSFQKSFRSGFDLGHLSECMDRVLSAEFDNEERGILNHAGVIDGAWNLYEIFTSTKQINKDEI